MLSNIINWYRANILHITERDLRAQEKRERKERDWDLREYRKEKRLQARADEQRRAQQYAQRTSK